MSEEDPATVEVEEPEEPVEAVDVEEPEAGETDAEEPEEEEEEPEIPAVYENANERLFLLEFIVDQVSVNFCGSKALRCIEGQTCVSFTFLENGPFNVCEADFTNRKNYTQGCTGSGSVKNGKSCMFSLTQDAIDKLNNKGINISVDAFKLKQNGTETPDKVIIGHTLIPIGFLFRELMTMVMTEENPVVTKTTKDCYRLKSAVTKDVIGHLTAYIRLTCFGKNIVNNFQMNLCDESVTIRTTPGYNSYKYTNKPCQTPPSDSNRPPCCSDLPMACCCSPPPACCGSLPCPPPICCSPPKCPARPCNPPPTGCPFCTKVSPKCSNCYRP